MVLPKVIFEDESLLIVDKPSGWITNEADTTTSQPVLQTWIKKSFNFPIFEYPELRAGIVHRLDKETSGVLLVAKTRQAFDKLQSQFKERKVQKTYTALVHGRVSPEKGSVEVAVGRLPWRRDRFGPLPGGRAAKTDFEVLKYLSKENEVYSLLKLNPKTGRTHQIRIHLKHLGFPIVSDVFYAGRKTARNDRRWCPRLFLHASGITFIHPKTGKLASFEAVLPEDLQEVLYLFSRLA